MSLDSNRSFEFWENVLPRSRRGAFGEYEKRMGNEVSWSVQGRGLFIHGIDIKPSIPHNRNLGDLGFSRVGRRSGVSGPWVNEKRDRLICHYENYPGLLRGDEGQGLKPWAPSVFSSWRRRRPGRTGSEDSCLGPGGDVRIPGGGFGQSTFQCPSMPQLGHRPGNGLSFRHEWTQWPSFATFEAGPKWLPVIVGWWRFGVR